LIDYEQDSQIPKQEFRLTLQNTAELLDSFATMSTSGLYKPAHDYPRLVKEDTKDSQLFFGTPGLLRVARWSVKIGLFLAAQRIGWPNEDQNQFRQFAAIVTSRCDIGIKDAIHRAEICIKSLYA
jgi:hypothetical protein